MIEKKTLQKVQIAQNGHCFFEMRVSKNFYDRFYHWLWRLMEHFHEENSDNSTWAGNIKMSRICEMPVNY